MDIQEKVEIDRITRVLEAHGWSSVSIDTRGDFIQVVIQKPKTKK